MGDDTETTKATNQTSVKTPWGPAAGALSGILGQLNNVSPGLSGTERGALGGLLGNAGFLQQFQPQVIGLANTLLGGGTDRTGMVSGGYDDYRNQLASTIGGQHLNPFSNPFFSQVTDRIGNEVQNRIKRDVCRRRRDPSGAVVPGRTSDAASRRALRRCLRSNTKRSGRTSSAR